MENDSALAAVVARKHFVGGMSKTEIADELFLSRFKVARLLQLAVDRGIVRFVIDLGDDAEHELARQLQSEFRLEHVSVVADDELADMDLFRAVGQAVVGHLAEIIREGDEIGISSSRSLMGLSTVTVPIAPATFVQVNGAVSRPDAADIIDGIRKLTQASNGRAHVFYAPLVTPDEASWRNYLQQPDVAVAFGRFERLAAVITGIGVWAEGHSVVYDNLPREIADQATSAGAIHEILGVPIDAEGRTVEGPARRRIVAPDAEMLHRIPRRIAVAVGEDKVEAVESVIRSGLVNSLITHRRLAEELLGA